MIIAPKIVAVIGCISNPIAAKDAFGEFDIFTDADLHRVRQRSGLEDGRGVKSAMSLPPIILRGECNPSYQKKINESENTSIDQPSNSVVDEKNLDHQVMGRRCND